LKEIAYTCHIATKHDGLCAVAVTDGEYPRRVAFGLLQQCFTNYEKEMKNKWADIEEDQDLEPNWLIADVAKFQEPDKADKISQIQKNLDDIKDIMHRNIDEVLKRGETIDSLMDKSQDLSAASLKFYKQAKKTNQCCKSY